MMVTVMVDSQIAVAGGHELILQLKQQEGYECKPYRDTNKVWTFGYGFNIQNGITEPEAAILLEFRVAKLMHRLPMVMRSYKKLSPVRQNVIINMAYNLGVSGMLGFHDMHLAIDHDDFEMAACAMLDSLWAVQVGDEPGQRAYELAEMMQAG